MTLWKSGKGKLEPTNKEDESLSNQRGKNFGKHFMAAGSVFFLLLPFQAFNYHRNIVNVSYQVREDQRHYQRQIDMIENRDYNMLVIRSNNSN